MARADLLVETDWLAQHLRDPDLRVVDMRGLVRLTPITPGVEDAEYLGALDQYAEGHIPGAVYLDWTRDIADVNDPIPAQIAPPGAFAAAMSRAGISDDTLVVAYDAHPAMQFATRLWWALRYYGHDRAAVLDGGLNKWRREGRPLSAEAPTVAPGRFTPRARPELRASAGDVLALIRSPRPDVTLVDARDEAQFTGQTRRGHGRAGHIPGALSLPRERLIDPATGGFLPNDQIALALDSAGVAPDRHVVAYCNGGIAATTVLFALGLLDRPDNANYDGSWNEWGSRDDLPVE